MPCADVSGAGSVLMKATTGPLLRVFGFRAVLVANGLLCGLCLASLGLFSPRTPIGVILVALLVFGFFRSLQYTSISAISFADVEQERMSSATGIASVANRSLSRWA
jgi:hypothetical protein